MRVWLGRETLHGYLEPMQLADNRVLCLADDLSYLRGGVR
jgi:hypothetical protein